MYQKFAYILSVVLHICIFIFLYKNTNFIVPSKPDGINIEVIRQVDDIKHVSTSNTIKRQTPNNVATIDNADVSLKSTLLKSKHAEIMPKNMPKRDPHKIKSIKPNQAKSNLDSLTDDLVSSINNNSRIKPKTNVKSIGSNSVDEAKISNYADLVINLVRPHVVIPDGVDIRLVTIVKVVLLPNMDVYEIKIVQSSGNVVYDNNVINAIKIVKKFPSIPMGDNWLDYRVINLTFKSD